MLHAKRLNRRSDRIRVSHDANSINLSRFKDDLAKAHRPQQPGTVHKNDRPLRIHFPSLHTAFGHPISLHDHPPFFPHAITFFSSVHYLKHSATSHSFLADTSHSLLILIATCLTEHLKKIKTIICPSLNTWNILDLLPFQQSS